MASRYGWWNTDYPYRREITFGTSHSYLPSGFTVELVMDTRPAYTNVARTDGRDIYIIAQKTTSPYTKVEVYRELKPGSSWNSASSHIRFKLRDYVNADYNRGYGWDYYVYYGNPDAPYRPDRTRYVYLFGDNCEAVDPSSISTFWEWQYATPTYQTSYPKYGSGSIKFYDNYGSNQGRLSRTEYFNTAGYDVDIEFWLRHSGATDHTFGLWNGSHWCPYIYFDDDHHIKYWKESTSSYVDTGYTWSENTYENYKLRIDDSANIVKLYKNDTLIASNCNPDGYDVTSTKLYFYGNSASTYIQYIDNVFYYYYVSNPPEESLGVEEHWAYTNFSQTLFVKALGHSDLSQRLRVAVYGHSDLQNEAMIRRSTSKDLPSQLNMRLSEDSNLDNQLLLEALGSSDILNELLLRQEASKDLNNQLLLKMYGTNLSQKLLMRRELYSTLLNELQIGTEKLDLEGILTTLERETFTDNYNNETYIDTLSDLVVEDGKVRLKKWGE